MSYERKVERAHPALIVMILDDSGSMSTSLPGSGDARYQWVERYSGIILKELLAGMPRTIESCHPEVDS